MPGCGGFNGAAASLRRKADGHGRGRFRWPALQWGRRFVAAEGSQPASARSRRSGASMGPPLRCGGRESPVVVPLLGNDSRFNGAAASLRRKAQKAVPCGPAMTSLQWGRRFVAAEGSPRRSATASHSTLQWGRRFVAAEGSCRAAERAPGTPRFNGAAASLRRKGILGAGPVSSGASPLQWGRRFVAAEGWGLARARTCHPGFNGAAASLRRKAAQQARPHRLRRASMGPPLRCGGRFPCFRRREPARRLQWGRRFVAAEGELDLPSRVILLVASMGPPLRCGGRWRPSWSTPATCTSASMGPPLRCGGRKAERVCAAQRTGPASMGPPLRCGGRPLGGVCSGGEVRRFNGAAASLRRKAARCHLRRRRRDAIASMGPPLRCGGRSPLVSAAEQQELLGFNGAAASLRRKASIPSLTGGGSVRLQWGRRFVAAEGPRRRPLSVRGLAASMGPPLRCGGRRSNDGPLSNERRSASMGPPLRCGGRSGGPSKRMPRTHRFNGAAASLRRKGGPHQAPAGPCPASMGPPLRCGGRSSPRR